MHNSRHVHVTLTNTTCSDQTFIFAVESRQWCENDKIVLNNIQRRLLKASDNDILELKIFDQPLNSLDEIQISVDFLEKKEYAQPVEIDDNSLCEELKKNHLDKAFYTGLKVAIRYERYNLVVTCLNSGQQGCGTLSSSTKIEIFPANSTIRLKSSLQQVTSFINPDFSFENFGVGGLDIELMEIFRKVFASRRLPPATLRKYGIKHAKGILLHGPPGCGKTLIARNLAKVLNSVTPKIVNGPSVLSEFVGKAEQNVRDLFADAMRDEKEKGDTSPLHVIIFDEMDAICKRRGMNHGTSSDVGDKIVNQLLTMIDGPESLNNILVIGMTNMKELLDPAIMRAGRFEYHFEVGLPDANGRHDILKIHTKMMKDNGVLSSDIDLQRIAQRATNFTGADIEQLVKIALSHTIAKVCDISEMGKAVNKELPPISQDDFNNAVSEIKPLYASDDVFKRNPHKVRIHPHDAQLNSWVNLLRCNKDTRVGALLIHGDRGTGKTSLAIDAALSNNIQYKRIISPSDLLGMSELARVNYIIQVFQQAYKAKDACIILDDVHLLIEYTEEGPRFSNTLLQAITALVKKPPPDSQSHLLVIATSLTIDFTPLMKNVFDNVFVTDCVDAKKAYEVLVSQGYLSSRALEVSRQIEDPVPVKIILDMHHKILFSEL